MATQRFFIFYPEPWGFMIQLDGRCHLLSDGLVQLNHQLFFPSPGWLFSLVFFLFFLGICTHTTWKGSMAQLPLVLVLSIAPYPNRHRTWGGWNRLPTFSDGFLHKKNSLPRIQRLERRALSLPSSFSWFCTWYTSAGHHAPAVGVHVVPLAWDCWRSRSRFGVIGKKMQAAFFFFNGLGNRTTLSSK